MRCDWERTAVSSHMPAVSLTCPMLLSSNAGCDGLLDCAWTRTVEQRHRPIEVACCVEVELGLGHRTARDGDEASDESALLARL